jgi:hypothetical protein
MWQKIVNFYNQNAYFHSFVVAVEWGLVSFWTSYSGGVPATKSAWASFGLALGGALWAALKRWMATNVATDGLNMKAPAPATPVVPISSVNSNTNQGNAGKI